VWCVATLEKRENLCLCVKEKKINERIILEKKEHNLIKKSVQLYNQEMVCHLVLKWLFMYVLCKINNMEIAMK